jgi:hypothetical protein
MTASNAAYLYNLEPTGIKTGAERADGDVELRRDLPFDQRDRHCRKFRMVGNPDISTRLRETSG